MLIYTKLMKFSKVSLAILLLFVIASIYALSAYHPRPNGPEISPNSAKDVPLSISESNIHGQNPDNESPVLTSGDMTATPENIQTDNDVENDIPQYSHEELITSLTEKAWACVIGQESIVKAANVMEALNKKAVNDSQDIPCAIIRGKIARGDTLAKILNGAGCDNANAYVNAAQKVYSLRLLQDGHPYLLEKNTGNGEAIRFEYDIDDQRKLVVEGQEHPAARVEKIDYTIKLASAAGIVNDNLFQTVSDIGEKPQMALKLVELFGSEINFIKNLQEGDSFSVLVEKRYLDGVFKGYGRFLAATFTNRGKKFEAYLFSANGDKKKHYYNAKGENLHKTLLQMPLDFTRVTSRFSHQRKHPILGYNRPHLGVDYGAPTGTPVKAVGDGIVTSCGKSGGYGNQIIIKHAAGLESMYAHLSRFARGLREGRKVAQGEVIGYVGSTGLSTGPHLDFRLRQNGAFVDPGKAINPRGTPVAANNMKEFTRIMHNCRAYLAGDLDMGKYNVDSLTPLDVSSEKVASAAKSSAGTNKKTIKSNIKSNLSGKRLKKAENARRNGRQKRRS